MEENDTKAQDREALLFHTAGRPGKIEITPTKPLTTQRDLSLAYSPGVAAPCLAIAEEASTAYDYTSKGNLVAVISNGSAVLGLGNLGALASKPVMEGKAVLFKRFADVDGLDLEVDTQDVDQFINAVRYLGPSFGGINLEDIKAPECFIIEQRLRELMDIPVFHDDQHGTAIIAASGLINACDLTGKSLKDIRLVINGAGAAAVACAELVKHMGVKHDNVIMCDSRGVIYRGREQGMNQWKSAHAAETDARSLADAMHHADAFFGLSVKGAVTPDMVESMAGQPIIFAMANPDPEIMPEDVKAVRKDAIIATGRSDYANQINNVLGFPYIFRGALDVQASTINEEMKVAAARAVASLAREDVPDEVAAAYGRKRLRYGPDYVIPAPFDPRLIIAVPKAVAQAAMESGVARKPIFDMEEYEHQLRNRLDPTASHLQLVSDYVRAHPKRIVFAEGEEERVIRAAIGFRNAGYGTPVLIGREERVRETAAGLGIDDLSGIEIYNAAKSYANKQYTEFLYKRLQRKGFLQRDCQRMINQKRNVFAATMVACGDADGMITGLTRNFDRSYQDIISALDTREGEIAMGLTIAVARGKTVFIADTRVHDVPQPAELADIAIQAAAKARQMGHEPRVALLSHSTFGNPVSGSTERVRKAVAELETRNPDFEFDGEMAVDVALDKGLLALYPFCRLTAPANVLIMPALHSANISAKLLGKLGGGTVIGPLLLGLQKPAEVVPMGATVNDIVAMAALAAHEADQRQM